MENHSQTKLPPLPWKWIVLSVAVSLLLSVAVFYIQLGNHRPQIMGLVTDLQETSLTVTNAQGRTVTIAISKKTDVRSRDETLAEGKFVHVTGHRTENGVEAETIRIIKPPRERNNRDNNEN